MGIGCFLPFYECLRVTFLFHSFIKTNPYESGGLNSNNRKAYLVIAIKKVSPIEQRLIYVSCYDYIYRFELVGTR